MSFSGAKLALFIGDKLAVILRDDIPTITEPDRWDFPGGGREGEETPEACALRETQEELGLSLVVDDLVWRCDYAGDDGVSWFFVAHLSASRVEDVRFGDEGQCWTLMSPEEYATHPKRIQRFADRLSAYQSSASGE